LLESVWKVDVPLLTTPEFNYGVPLLVIVVTAVAVVVLSTLLGSRIPD